jgi:hypothetical protein
VLETLLLIQRPEGKYEEEVKSLGSRKVPVRLDTDLHDLLSG